MEKDPLGASDKKGKSSTKNKGQNKGGVQKNVINYNGEDYKPQHITQALNKVGEGSKLKGNQKNETLEARISELTPEGRSKFDTFLSSREEDEGTEGKVKE